MARTDLAALADELLGGHVGRGRSAKWPSPVPGHPQTGKSPPMSVFRTRAGEERWTCFSTGQSGTAIDLVMTAHGCDVSAAIAWLAVRSGLGPASEVQGGAEPVRAARRGGLSPVVADDTGLRPVHVHPRVEAYVATCERLLWGAQGAAARSWLMAERGLAEGVLRANRVGFDPGPEAFARPKGLPRLGPGVVLPVLGERSRATFFQVRYLDPDTAGRKYDNPPGWLAPNPKLATVRPGVGSTVDDDRVIVTEGLPDALAAATAGHSAIAILGTSNTSLVVARQLADIDATLVVAFDADEAGRAGSARLVASLAARGRTERVTDLRPPPEYGDLNTWICADPVGAAAALGQRTVVLPRAPFRQRIVGL